MLGDYLGYGYYRQALKSKTCYPNSFLSDFTLPEIYQSTTFYKKGAVKVRCTDPSLTQSLKFGTSCLHQNDSPHQPRREISWASQNNHRFHLGTLSWQKYSGED